VTLCDTGYGCHTCVRCHTCHKYQCHVSLVNKLAMGDLLVTDFNKVWVGQKVIPRPSADYFVVSRRQKWSAAFSFDFFCPRSRQVNFNLPLPAAFLVEIALALFFFPAAAVSAAAAATPSFFLFLRALLLLRCMGFVVVWTVLLCVVIVVVAPMAPMPT
jgi:hypothetical protein